jgi:hypothetical protein
MDLLGARGFHAEQRRQALARGAFGERGPVEDAVVVGQRHQAQPPLAG